MIEKPFDVMEAGRMAVLADPDGAMLCVVKELGGEVLAGPMEPGAGRIAVVSDPQGAVFAVFEGETDE